MIFVIVFYIYKQPKSLTLKKVLLDSLRLNAILESSVDSIITINERGLIQSVNIATSKLFGYGKEELIGQNVSVLMPNPHAKNHDKYLSNYLETGVAKIIGIGREVEAKHKSGEIFPVLLSISEVKFEDGVIFTGIIHDITEIKEAEKKLRVLNSQLEERVEERTSKLTDVVNKLLKTNRDLENEVKLRKEAEDALICSEKELKSMLSKEKELNDMKSKFVTLASHEFRTPLSTILSSANLIEKYEKEDDQEKRERHVKKISQAVHNLNNILNDFLSLGKLDEGKIGYEISSFCLKSLIKDVSEQLEGMLKPGQSIKLFLEEEIMINNDKNMMHNILVNLISNAIKYSPQNSDIEIYVQSVSKDIMKVCVRDHGIGIPESEQGNIFSRFFRANNASTYQGTGLGLHLVQSYAEKMGGMVSFESKCGEGSKFYVTIPSLNIL